MSDLETLKEMLLRAGYTEVAGESRNRYGDDGKRFSVSTPAAHGHPFPKCLDLDRGDGYDGFVCSFYFDADGNLIGHGVWE